MSGLLHAQIDAARVSTRQEQAVNAQRHVGVRLAVRHLLNQSPVVALDAMFRSVEKQALMAGCGPEVCLPDPYAAVVSA